MVRIRHRSQLRPSSAEINGVVNKKVTKECAFQIGVDGNRTSKNNLDQRIYNTDIKMKGMKYYNIL